MSLLRVPLGLDTHYASISLGIIGKGIMPE